MSSLIITRKQTTWDSVIARLFHFIGRVRFATTLPLMAGSARLRGVPIRKHVDSKWCRQISAPPVLEANRVAVETKTTINSGGLNNEKHGSGIDRQRFDTMRTGARSEAAGRSDFSAGAGF